MILPEFTYLVPETLEEASKLAKEYDGKCKVMAGGTDIIVAMKEHVITPEYIIEIKEIQGLDYLDYSPEEGLKIGALTSLRTIEKSLLVQEKFRAVADAAHYVASTQVRSKGTMVGNLVNASPSADTHLTPFDTGTLGSRGTFLAGNGARRAAADAKRQLIETVSSRLGV